MRNALRHVAELTYVNAPMPYVPQGKAKEDIIRAFGNIAQTDYQRIWFNANKDNTEYIGLDMTLKYLDGVFATMGPFDGILGFCQGACVAAILAAKNHGGV
eukprot:UN20829